jgi:hypothetical protein
MYSIITSVIRRSTEMKSVIFLYKIILRHSWINTFNYDKFLVSNFIQESYTFVVNSWTTQGYRYLSFSPEVWKRIVILLLNSSISERLSIFDCHHTFHKIESTGNKWIGVKSKNIMKSQKWKDSNTDTKYIH